jgi:hypothetical protein
MIALDLLQSLFEDGQSVVASARFEGHVGQSHHACRHAEIEPGLGRQLDDTPAVPRSELEIANPAILAGQEHGGADLRGCVAAFFGVARCQLG